MPANERYSVEEIVERVTRAEQATLGRRGRMDEDYALQRGDAYDTNTDVDGGDAGTDFRSFTANEAGSFVRKIVSLLTTAKLMIEVPYGRAQAPARQFHDIKERFAESLLEQSNEALARQIKIALLDQWAWFAPVRGWLTSLAVFRNMVDGRTVPICQPWDPRNVYWEMGEDGPEWVCERTSRTAGEIRASYPRASLTTHAVDELFVVYNFFTGQENAVLTDDVFLKPWTRHGAPRVPVIITPVPTQPEIWSPASLNNEQGRPESLDDYGESILATNRGLYKQLNETLSIVLELMAKAREPAGIVFTDEEDTEMDEHPAVTGGLKYLGGQDKYMPVPVPETTKDALQLLGAVTGMIQRGAIPYSTYGQLEHPISGYAITQLNQQLMTAAGPVAKCISQHLKGVLDMWVEQYETGQFWPVKVQG